MKCAPGWWWRFPVMCALIGGFFMVLTFTVGPTLGAASSAVGWVADRIGGSS